MADKITVPTLGESVTEATVSKWLKVKGEKVAADEPLVELETDKVNVEVPSPISGILGSISVKEGETVNVGSLLGTIENSSSSVKNNIKEIKNYSPPEIEKEKPKLKIFEEEKISKPKKTKEKKLEESKLILDDEKPLTIFPRGLGAELEVGQSIERARDRGAPARPMRATRRRGSRKKR